MSDDQKRDSVSDHTSQANDARAPKETPNEQSTQDQSQAEHSEAPRRPDQVAYTITEGKEGKGFFNEIGSSYDHKDGKGSTINLFAIPVDGKVVLRNRPEKLREQSDSPDPHQNQERDADQGHDR